MSEAHPAQDQSPANLPLAAKAPSWHWAVLLLLIALAVAVCAPGIGLGSLSSDEAFSWRLTQYPATDLILRTGADVHPPLYYLVLQGWVSIWGEAPSSLRGLSLLCGVLCVPLLYLVCREAGADAPASWGGALLSALLLAIHVSQVTPSRNARMYSLGVLLAGLTAWLLLRALRSQRLSWWTGYGLAVTAFCYTHYYAFFTVAAQVVFVVGDLLWRWRAGRGREATSSAVGFLYAGVLALLLFAPWMPVLWAEVDEVRRDYWIDPVTGKMLAATFTSWATGLEYQPGALFDLLMLGTVLAVVAALWPPSRAAWFFLLQAAVPWGLSLGISVLGGRSIFFERYLAFAHFFFLGLLGVLWCRLPGRAERVLLAFILLVTTGSGLWVALARYPDRPTALVAAAEFLRGHHQAGEPILVGSPYQVNQIRYYARRAGLDGVDVRSSVSPTTDPIHIPHLSSLPNRDIQWPGREMPPRFWQATESGGNMLATPPGARVLVSKSFREADGNWYCLTLVESEE